MTPDESPESIEQLRKRFERLRDDKTRAEANLQNAQQNLEKIKAQAREEFNTDDPDELQAMLEKILAENESKRAAYQKHLNEIEENLEKLESNESQ